MEQHISVAGPPQIKLITPGPEPDHSSPPIGPPMRKCDGMSVFNTLNVIPSKAKHLPVLQPSLSALPGPRLLLKMW